MYFFSCLLTGKKYLIQECDPLHPSPLPFGRGNLEQGVKEKIAVVLPYCTVSP